MKASKSFAATDAVDAAHNIVLPINDEHSLSTAPDHIKTEIREPEHSMFIMDEMGEPCKPLMIV